MTFERRNNGKSHSYTLNGVRVPGVTTVIGQLDKPALINWAAEQTASYAVDNWAWLASKTTSEKFKLLSGARHATNKQAIAKGNEIHAMAEAQLHGRPVEVPPELASDVTALCRLLEEWRIEPVETELAVGNSTEMYAGTADLFARSDRLGGLHVMDVKTGKGVYSEVALQLCAYSRCDVAGRPVVRRGPRGGKLPDLWVEEPAPVGVDLDRGFVIHVAQGVAELMPVAIDERVWQAFQALLDLWWSWTVRTDYRNRDQPDYDPPVGQPIHASTSVEAPF